jgi:hypothetical protein
VAYLLIGTLEVEVALQPLDETEDLLIWHGEVVEVHPLPEEVAEVQSLPVVHSLVEMEDLLIPVLIWPLEVAEVQPLPGKVEVVPLPEDGEVEPLPVVPPLVEVEDLLIWPLEVVEVHLVQPFQGDVES